MNDVVQLSFYPVGGFSNPDIQKSVNCPNHGNDVNCTGDMYESCMLQEFCGGVACPSEQQLMLVKFLDCFENLHDSNMSMADTCAQQAGFDVTKVRSCFDNHAAADSAWQTIVNESKAIMPTMHCFPWVLLNGEVISTDPNGGCLGQDAGTYPLLQELCGAAIVANLDTPAVCGNSSVALRARRAARARGRGARTARQANSSVILA